MRSLILAAGLILLPGISFAADYTCAAANQPPVSYRIDRGKLVNLRDNSQFTTLRQGNGYIIAAKSAPEQEAVSVMLINTSQNKFRLTVLMGDGRAGSVEGACQVQAGSSGQSRGRSR